MIPATMNIQIGDADGIGDAKPIEGNPFRGIGN